MAGIHFRDTSKAEQPSLCRIQTARGERIRFSQRPAKSKPPEFCAGHPAVAFMRAFSDEVLAGCGHHGRFWIDGKWRDTRPGRTDAHGADDEEEVA